ncbi:MAG: YhjD/YihY/BrkB family envelope integrity protein [Thermoanaerobaculia bacterium]
MSDTETILEELRRRFRPADRADSKVALPRKIFSFLILAVRKASADDLTQKSAALAFSTMISLVPLLAAFSFLGARWFDRKQALAVEVLTRILPYSQETIIVRIQEFLDQAQAIRGLGFALFMATALMVFTLVERTMNKIWNVSDRRPLRSRLLSFTLVLFWGPLVIGTTYTALFFLRQQPILNDGPLALPADFVPFIMTLLALTMLYWLVPFTSVRFSSAFAGSFTAALLLEGLRQGFGLYVDQIRSFSIIYGSFGLALLFMISIQLAWWIVLLGSEVAYCLQNYGFMSRQRRAAGPAEGSWIALAALVFVTHRFRGGEPITPYEMLAESLQLETNELHKVLEPLLDDGILKESSGDPEGYLLAEDPHDLAVTRVFELYEGLHWQLLAPLPDGLADGLERLRAKLAQERGRVLQSAVLAELAATVPTEDEVSASTLPADAD